VKPNPVVITTICSDCGLDWDDHGENPTSAVCIRLLKEALARKPTTVTTIYPWVQPWPQVPYVQPGRIYPSTTFGGSTGGYARGNSGGNALALAAARADGTT
jgi:hypothetical protein